MNKQMKQHLEAVVSAIVEQDTKAAKAAFHDYLRLKSQSILMGESVEEESHDDEDEDKKDDDKEESDKDDSDGKSDKSDKSDKKDEEDENCEM